MAQADVYPLEWEGREALLKTFHARPAIVKWLWSRRVAAREIRMLARLAGMRDVPELLAVAGREAFVMTRLPARRLPGRKEPAPQKGYWRRARDLMEAMHARGIAHGDLRRKNLLMDQAGAKPFMIDFATAVARPAEDAPRTFDNWLKAFLFERCVRIDRITFVRIKRAYRAKLTAEERAWLAAEPWYLKAGRFFKRIYRFRKGRYWRNWLHRQNKAQAERAGRPRPKKRKRNAPPE